MVRGSAKAGSVGVGGELEAQRLISERDLKVGRNLTTTQGAKGGEVEIGNNGVVKGPLVGESVKVKHGSTTDDIYAEELWLGDDCSVGNIYAERAEVGRGCRVSGKLLYTEDVSLGKDVSLNAQPEKVGSLPSPPL